MLHLNISLKHVRTSPNSFSPTSRIKRRSVRLPAPTRAPDIITYEQGDSFFLYLSRGFKIESLAAQGGLLANPVLPNLFTSLTHLSGTL